MTLYMKYILFPGNVKNTKPLYYREMHSYIIQVVAKDCGNKKSKPISINIRIKEVCKNGWKGKKGSKVSGWGLGIIHITVCKIRKTVYHIWDVSDQVQIGIKTNFWPGQLLFNTF